MANKTEFRTDLFNWREDGETVVNNSNAPRTLTKPPPDTNIQTTLCELPLDRLERLREIRRDMEGDDK